MVDENDHDCTAHLEPEHNGTYRDEDGDHLSAISGTITGAGVVLFMQCRKCGAKYDVTYELSDIEPCDS